MTTRKPDHLLTVDALSRREAAGFTMVELVVTLIVIGILAINLLPRLDGLGSFDAAGYADQTLSLFRYAQKTAIAQRRWVSIDAGTTPPRLCSQTDMPGCASSCAGGSNVSQLALPGGAGRAPRASTVVTQAGTTVAPLLCFDAVGRPIAAGASAPTTTATTFEIRDGGTLVRTITIEAESGYAY